MSTTNELLAKLNAMYEVDGLPKIKVWKESKEKLLARIARHEAEVKRNPTPLKKMKSAKNEDKPGRKGEFAEWCRANGFNPKVARAKLRKANHRRNGSRYELNEKAIAIVKGK
ncbi:MAG: hypothetical protein CGW95_00990 [Phenylobacterium zucineum]|nr:MAG: hypothetical protein CGW95_00990 [Phenylobacterium zucineum]